MKVAAFAGIIAAIAMASCAPTEFASPWYPLREGGRWTFNVQTGLTNRVETIDVDSRDSVANQAGWRLRGPGGDSRITWKDGVLVADELSGTRFMPALPILAPDKAHPKKSKESAPVTQWKGTIVIGARAMNGSARLTVTEDAMTVLGKNEDVLRTDLEVTVGDKTRVVTTWYAKGLGIYRQEERHGDLMERASDYLKGP